MISGAGARAPGTGASLPLSQLYLDVAAIIPARNSYSAIEGERTYITKILF